MYHHAEKSHRRLLRSGRLVGIPAPEIWSWLPTWWTEESCSGHTTWCVASPEGAQHVLSSSGVDRRPHGCRRWRHPSQIWQQLALCGHCAPGLRSGGCRGEELRRGGGTREARRAHAVTLRGGLARCFPVRRCCRALLRLYRVGNSAMGILFVGLRDAAGSAFALSIAARPATFAGGRRCGRPQCQLIAAQTGARRHAGGPGHGADTVAATRVHGGHACGAKAGPEERRAFSAFDGY